MPPPAECHPGHIIAHAPLPAANASSRTTATKPHPMSYLFTFTHTTVCRHYHFRIHYVDSSNCLLRITVSQCTYNLTYRKDIPLFRILLRINNIMISTYIQTKRMCKFQKTSLPRCRRFCNFDVVRVPSALQYEFRVPMDFPIYCSRQLVKQEKSDAGSRDAGICIRG